MHKSQNINHTLKTRSLSFAQIIKELQPLEHTTNVQGFFVFTNSCL